MSEVEGLPLTLRKASRIHALVGEGDVADDGVVEVLKGGVVEADVVAALRVVPAHQRFGQGCHRSRVPARPYRKVVE